MDNLKLLNEYLEPSLSLRGVSFCKADGGRDLLAALWGVIFCVVLWGSEYSSFKVRVMK